MGSGLAWPLHRSPRYFSATDSVERLLSAKLKKFEVPRVGKGKEGRTLVVFFPCLDSNTNCLKGNPK